VLQLYIQKLQKINIQKLNMQKQKCKKNLFLLFSAPAHVREGCGGFF